MGRFLASLHCDAVLVKYKSCCASCWFSESPLYVQHHDSEPALGGAPILCSHNNRQTAVSSAESEIAVLTSSSSSLSLSSALLVLAHVPESPLYYAQHRGSEPALADASTKQMSVQVLLRPDCLTYAASSLRAARLKSVLHKHPLPPRTLSADSKTTAERNSPTRRRSGRRDEAAQFWSS